MAAQHELGNAETAPVPARPEVRVRAPRVPQQLEPLFGAAEVGENDAEIGPVPLVGGVHLDAARRVVQSKIEQSLLQKSEERRVGKECRSRWTWEQSRKQNGTT